MHGSAFRTDRDASLVIGRALDFPDDYRGGWDGFFGLLNDEFNREPRRTCSRKSTHKPGRRVHGVIRSMPSFDLSGTQEPWVVFARRDSDAVAAQLQELTSKGGRIYRFEAAKLHDAQALFQEFAAQLEFPSYFGRNWDAMVDCLDDLCAVVTNRIGVAGVIEGADSLLDAPFFRILVSVLCQGAARANSDVDLDGEPLDRPAIIQHFVFLLDENPTERIAATLDHRDLVVDLSEEYLTVTLNPEVWSRRWTPPPSVEDRRQPDSPHRTGDRR